MPSYGGQIKRGQHFKFNAVSIALAPLQSLRAVHIDAGQGLHVQVLHDLVDMHVDQILAGFFVNLVAEALFNDRSGHLALAETVQLHGSFIQGHGAHDGRFHFLRFRGDHDLFLNRRKIFSAVFHVGLLSGNGDVGAEIEA